MSLCGICELLRDCNANVVDKSLFMTYSLQLLCEMAEAGMTGPGEGAAITQGGEGSPQFVSPVSVATDWVTVVNAGRVNVVDNANITNPDTQISLATHPLLVPAAGAGTTMLLRVRYDAGLTAPTSPVVRVFGRTTSTPASGWQKLLNRAAAPQATLTLDVTNDVTDGTWKYTTPAIATTAWDVMGNGTAIVGIQTALAGTGTVNNAIIQARMM